jgi:hypothetical protein
MGAMEVLPAPVVETPAEGTVIVPEEVLKTNEKIIRTNLPKLEKYGNAIGRALNIIYHNGLWKLHKQAGKQRYTNFDDYLENEFGWDKTAARARQIMKADAPAAIEAGDIPEDSIKERKARVIEYTPEMVAKQTAKELVKTRNAFTERYEKIEPGVKGDALPDIYDTFVTWINHTIDQLEQIASPELADGEAATDEE